MGRKPKRNPKKIPIFWTKAEDRVISFVARRIVKGTLTGPSTVVPVFRAELAKRGIPDVHKDSAVAHRLSTRAHKLGWDSGMLPPWTAAQDRVIDAYVDKVLDGSVRSAYAAAPICHKELQRLPDWTGRSQRKVFARLAVRLRRIVGRRRPYHPWTEAERAVLDKHARAFRASRDPRKSITATAERCLTELKATGVLSAPRNATGVHGRLLKRLRDMGLSYIRIHWTKDEKVILDRYAQRVGKGEYAIVSTAATDCLRELKELRAGSGPLRPDGKVPGRKRYAVEQRIGLRVRALYPDRDVGRWSEKELRVLERYVRTTAAGKYTGLTVALRDCVKEIPGRHFLAVKGRLLEMARKMPDVQLNTRDWLKEEVAVIDRLLRDCRPSFDAAAVVGLRRLRRLRERRPQLFVRTRDRTLSCVRLKMTKRADELGLPLRRRPWTDDEMRWAELFAKAAIEHRYPSVMAAARLCRIVINRMHARHRRPGDRPVDRPTSTVHKHIMRRVKEIGPFRVGNRPWTDEEIQVADRWAAKYDEHVRGELVMGLKTMGAMMQEQLDRMGYWRTPDACSAFIEYRYVRIYPANDE